MKVERIDVIPDPVITYTLSMTPGEMAANVAAIRVARTHLSGVREVNAGKAYEVLARLHAVLVD